MFKMRFPDAEVEGKSIKELRGMEGLRVRTLYAQLGVQHGVTWKGRNYDRTNWDTSDDINRALSAANASLYALCAATRVVVRFAHGAIVLPTRVGKTSTLRRFLHGTTQTTCPVSTPRLGPINAAAPKLAATA